MKKSLFILIFLNNWLFISCGSWLNRAERQTLRDWEFSGYTELIVSGVQISELLYTIPNTDLTAQMGRNPIPEVTLLYNTTNIISRNDMDYLRKSWKNITKNTIEYISNQNLEQTPGKRILYEITENKHLHTNSYYITSFQFIEQDITTLSENTFILEDISVYHKIEYPLEITILEPIMEKLGEQNHPENILLIGFIPSALEVGSFKQNFQSEISKQEIMNPLNAGYSNLIVSRLTWPYVTFCFAGDVMLERYISQKIINGLDPFEDVSEILQNATYAFVNLETSVGSNSSAISGKDYTFQTPPERMSFLTNASIDVVSLANNHTMDYGDEGMNETLFFLEHYGIDHTGAGTNYDEAVIPVMYDYHGTSIGILAFGDIYPTKLYADDGPGIAKLDSSGVITEIEKWENEVDFLIISLHTGIEYEDNPNYSQKEFAHDFIDTGADLIIMHHPHEIQGIENYSNRMIFYSLGNFVFDQRSGETRMSMIGELVLESAYDTQMRPVMTAKYSVIPIMKSYSTYFPETAEGDDLTQVTNRLLTLSQKLNEQKLLFIKDSTTNYEKFIIDFK